MPIQQAIFTSAQTQRGDGYQLVAKSRGIWEEDERELETWCPSHDALAQFRSSVNFHRLPSGAFCIARTTAEGGEYSHRGGPRIHTHCLVVDPDQLSRFANNPFALIRAAVASGAMDRKDVASQQLAEINLVGRASAVNKKLIDESLQELGPSHSGSYVNQAVHEPKLLVIGGDQTKRLLELLVNCVPVECRVDFSFSTGLRYSPRRPFRITGCCQDEREQRSIIHRFGLVPWQPAADDAATTEGVSGWGRFLSRALREAGSEVLAAHFVRPRPDVSLQTLDELARELEQLPRVPTSALGSSTADTQTIRVSQLQLLETQVHEAISGRPGALEALTSLWPEVQARVGHTQIDQSREKCLGIAKRVWDEFLHEGSNPQQAHAALNVVCVLFSTPSSPVATTSR